MFIELPLFLCCIILWGQIKCVLLRVYSREQFSILECTAWDGLPRAETPGVEGAAQVSVAGTLLQSGR